jgi:Lon protease-like protein
MKLPERVAVMSLPNAILFPRVLLPLYIFEPRYKEMLEDCLAGDRMFAVALLRKGWEHEGRNPAPYPVATVGVIRTCVGRPDGTSNLILEGVARVSIVEYVRQRPYRVARVEPLEDFGSGTATESEPLVKTVSKLIDARARLGAEIPKSVVHSLLSAKNLSYLSDLASYTLLDSYHDKQLMLETLDVNQRLDQLVKLLQKQIRQFELCKTLQGNLPNEHVGDN